MKQWANLSKNKKTTVARTEGSNLLPAFVTVNTSKRRTLIASPHTVWSMSFEVHCHWRPSMWIVPWCSYKCVFLMNLLYYSPFTLGSGTEPLPDGSINSNVFVKRTKFWLESSWWKFLFLISKASNKANTRITRVVLMRKYSGLQQRPCGSSLSCPRSAEHVKNYTQNFKFGTSKLKFWISIFEFLKFWFRWPTPPTPPPHTISSKI